MCTICSCKPVDKSTIIISHQIVAQKKKGTNMINRCLLFSLPDIPVSVTQYCEIGIQNLQSGDLVPLVEVSRYFKETMGEVFMLFKAGFHLESLKFLHFLMVQGKYQSTSLDLCIFRYLEVALWRHSAVMSILSIEGVFLLCVNQ